MREVRVAARATQALQPLQLGGNTRRAEQRRELLEPPAQRTLGDVDPLRPARARGKVASSLKEIGWKADPLTLDLMRTYRMDQILNDSTHLFLSDAMRDKSTTSRAEERTG